MPLVRHRLDCCICLETQTQESIQALQELFDSIQDAHLKGENVPCDSFYSCSFEKSKKMRLYANHQGGYRVRCPKCAQNIASDFSKSVHHWRKGAAFEMVCSFCMEKFSLSHAVGTPPFAFSLAAIILHDVEVAEIGELWHKRIVEELGTFRVVFRRVG